MFKKDSGLLSVRPSFGFARKVEGRGGRGQAKAVVVSPSQAVLACMGMMETMAHRGSARGQDRQLSRAQRVTAA